MEENKEIEFITENNDLPVESLKRKRNKALKGHKETKINEVEKKVKEKLNKRKKGESDLFFNEDKENFSNFKKFEKKKLRKSEKEAAKNLVLLKQASLQDIENIENKIEFNRENKKESDRESNIEDLEVKLQDFTHPLENTPLLREDGSVSLIQPIYSSVKVFSDRIDTNQIDNYNKLNNFKKPIYKEELLNDFKELADIEIKSLENIASNLSETYFPPPNFFIKKPIDYLKDAAKLKQKKKEAKLYNKHHVDQDSANSNLKSFNDINDAIFLVNASTKTYKCPWDSCEKVFPSLSRVKRHYIIHTDFKPFKCLNLGCNRDFSRKDNMLQHCRVHCPFADRSKRNNLY